MKKKIKTKIIQFMCWIIAGIIEIEGVVESDLWKASLSYGNKYRSK